MKPYSKNLSVLLVVSIIGFVVVTVTNLVSAHQGNITLIHACVKNAGGSVRIVGPNDSCNGNESPLHWSPEAPTGGGVFTFTNIHQLDFGTTAGSCASFFGIYGTCNPTPLYDTPMPSGGALTTLAVMPYLNTAAQTITATVYVNDVATALTVAIPGGSTTTVFASAVVPVAAGDRVRIQANNSIVEGEGVEYNGTVSYRVP